MEDHEFSDTNSGYTVGAPRMTRGGVDENGERIVVTPMRGSFINSEHKGSIINGSFVKGQLVEIAEEPEVVEV